jgi:hypothetical protein
MRHTAVSCFPSMRVHWYKLRSAKGLPRPPKIRPTTVDAPSASPAETRNGQHCRRRKGLMRHTAMSCFPSMRVHWYKLRSAKGLPRPPKIRPSHLGTARHFEFGVRNFCARRWSLRKLVQQCLLQIARVEPLRKPLVHRSTRAGIYRANSTLAEAAKISAKPKISATLTFSPVIRTVETTPTTGIPSAPSDAVAAGSRRRICSHVA